MNTLGGNIVDWKIIGDATNFTVLGFTSEGTVMFWREGKWNVL